LNGEVFDTVTHVEFQILFPRDIGSAASCHIVIITANMHQITSL